MTCCEYNTKDHIHFISFFHNLQIGPISLSVSIHLAGKPCEGQKPNLIVPVCNYIENYVL